MLNKKFIIISGSIIIILLVVGVFILLKYANPWVEDKLSQQLNALKESPLNLSYKKLNVNILSGNASLDSVSLSKQEGKNHYTFNFDRLDVDGLGVMSYIFNNKIKLGKVRLSKPHIEFTRVLDSDTLNQKETSEAIKLPDLLIKSFKTNEGSFSIYNKREDKKNQFATGLFDLSLKELETDSAESHEYTYFDVNKLNIELNDINLTLPDSLTQASIQHVSLNAKTGTILIDSMHLKSRYEKYKLAHVVNHEIDWMDIHNPSVKISGIDVPKLIAEGAYAIKCITIEGLDAVLFRDKRLPFPEKPDTKLLHQVIADLKVQLAVDTIKVKNGNIEYQEFIKKGVGPGTVTFKELYATFYNFTNVDSIQEKVKYTAHMDAQSKVMGKSLLKASFSFPLVNNNQLHTVSGNLEAVDLVAFNPMLEDVAFVSIEKGQLKDLNFEFKYNNDASNGTMHFEYEDLKINTLDKESNSSEGLGEDIKSFIANTFVVRTNNLKKDSFRVGDIEFERDKKKSIFNYWWKSLLTGFRSSTGIKAPKEKIDIN